MARNRSGLGRYNWGSFKDRYHMERLVNRPHPRTTHWRIQMELGKPLAPPPPRSNFFFIFMQFSGKYGLIMGWRAPLLGVGVLHWEILDPPLQPAHVISTSCSPLRLIYTERKQKRFFSLIFVAFHVNIKLYSLFSIWKWCRFRVNIEEIGFIYIKAKIFFDLCRFLRWILNWIHYLEAISLSHQYKRILIIRDRMNMPLFSISTSAPCDALDPPRFSDVSVSPWWRVCVSLVTCLCLLGNRGLCFSCGWRLIRFLPDDLVMRTVCTYRLRPLLHRNHHKIYIHGQNRFWTQSNGPSP